MTCIAAAAYLLGGAGCATSPPAPFTQSIEGTVVSFEMVPITGESGTFWMQTTEVTWEQYDTFVFGLDLPKGVTPDTDALTRPTRPYIAVDRGYGHNGYPALSMSFAGAEAYAAWLTARSRRTYSVPTLAQWQAACNAGAVDGASLDAVAWHAGNAQRSTHRVASKEADAAGLYDMHGNVGEWVLGPDGPRLVGGHFKDESSALGTNAILVPSAKWNESDPQIPRSPWWLADAPWVGMRVVCSDGGDGDGNNQ